MNEALRVLLVIRDWLGWWIMNPLDDLKRLRATRKFMDEGNRTCVENARYVKVLQVEGARSPNVERR